MTMTDNVDFKRVRGSAEDIVAFYAKFDRPLSHEQARELENARAILALCELLKEVTSVKRAGMGKDLTARIKAAIGA